MNSNDLVLKSSCIGNTELYQLKYLIEPGFANIFAKCEFQNPTGSHKDRVFSHIINELEKSGAIHPGMTLIDCSTGNGGAALAQIANSRGYKVIIFMPSGMTIERKTQIQSFGAEIIETSSESFLNYAEEKAREYVLEHPGSYFLDQSSNQLNWQAWQTCGKEIVDQFKELNLTIDLFVCSIGTGGTFSGIAEQLKIAFPNIRTIAIEVDKSAPLYAKRQGQKFVHSSHNLMGLGSGKIAMNLQENLVDDVVLVTGADGWKTMKELISEEKLFVGPTAGSNVHVALQYSKILGSGKNIVTVLFDAAWKYFSVWDGNYEEYKNHLITFTH